MTNEEATKIIEGEKKCLYYQLNGMCGDFEKCVKTKLDFPYYKVELAFETAIEALEKQIPKKPGETEAYPHRLYCSNCYYPFERNKSEIALIREHFIVGNKYCPDCGQALDWSDEE